MYVRKCDLCDYSAVLRAWFLGCSMQAKLERRRQLMRKITYGGRCRELETTRRCNFWRRSCGTLLGRLLRGRWRWRKRAMKTRTKSVTMMMPLIPQQNWWAKFTSLNHTASCRDEVQQQSFHKHSTLAVSTMIKHAWCMQQQHLTDPLVLGFLPALNKRLNTVASQKLLLCHWIAG